MTTSQTRPTETPIERVAVDEGYDRWSSLYDDDDNPLIALEEPQLIDLLGDVRGKDVLDLGCGAGRHALRMAGEGAHVTAVDFSDGMLSVVRRKPGAQSLRLMRHDLRQWLPFADGEFDRLVCCLVLDHIPTLEPLFREMRRVLRGAGCAAISVLHPAMTLRGVQARFIDPASGNQVQIDSATHQTSDYVMNALRAGLVIDHMSEHAVGEELAARSARAKRYLGWPMLLMLRLKRRD